MAREAARQLHTFQVTKQTNDVLDHEYGGGYFSFNNRTPHHRHSRQDTPMRTSRSLRSSLTLAAFCAAAGSPVAAQQSAVAGNVRAVVNASASADVAAPRTVAIYTFGSSRSSGVPSQVTVLDSAGIYQANFRLPGSTAMHEMAVDAIQGDLHLQGVTPSGILTLVLYPIEANDAGTVIGRWQVGSSEGELLRRVKR